MNGHKIIINKSTVPVGTGGKVRAAVASRTKHKFDVVSNPEFLKEGAAIEDFMKPDRVVIGAENPKAAEIMQELYAPFVRTGKPILIMDIRSSEMTKYASNALLATKISFINEMAKHLRQSGRGYRPRAQGNGIRQAHRLRIPVSGGRVRRIVLSQGRQGPGPDRKRAGDRCKGA